MAELALTRIGLPTGVTLKVAIGGVGEPILFLHGFPESHRSWRHVLHNLSADHQVIAPDQRGFSGSDKPPEVAAYRTKEIVADVIALADALDIERFTLVGHDWGGAIAWAAALKHPGRVERLVIVNAPHPLIFQRSLIEDEAQRAASSYINDLRSAGAEIAIRAMGFETFLERTIGREADLRKLPESERQAMLDDWAQPHALSAMLNWYRATDLIVPEVGEKARRPLWTHLPFPKVAAPTLVVWGLKDKALLPVQLEGLADHVPDISLVTEPDAGHFIVWERPELVTRAIRDFLGRTRRDAASAMGQT
ncbi:MAG: alpha/beta hydrolase [Alphaproteobacteria bacterium]|nr:alpha/beta hydrolase [Alphaproteobacteria bacterium]